jgi:hypothetical protein
MYKLILDKQAENPYNEPHVKRLKGKADLYRKKHGGQIGARQ